MGIDKISIDELKKANVWITYKKEIDSKTGKANKTPTGKTNTPQTWLSYSEAQERCKKQGYAGVGFVTFDGETRSKFANIPPYLTDTQLCFIDLDSKTGELDAAQQVILNTFKGKTYIERSISGKGLHIYALCDLDKLPPKQGDLYGIKKGNKEMYCTSNRFAVFTGNQTQDSHAEGYITNQTALILETLKRFFPKNTPIKTDKEKTQGEGLPAALPANDNYPTTVDELVKLAKNGKYSFIFEDLYDNLYDENSFPYDKMFQTYRRSFDSQSDVDYFICIQLAILSGCNRQLIYDAFSASAPGAREKWQQRDDYAARTINNAITSVQSLPDKYKSFQVAKTAPFLWPKKTDLKTGEVTKWVIDPPKLKAYFCDTVKYILVQDDMSTQLRIFLYDGGYYRPVSDNYTQGVMKQIVEKFDPYAVMMDKIKEAYNNLTTDLNFHRSEELNADENLIVFNNGVLNIDTMELMQHSSDYLITHKIPCDFNRELTEKDAPAFMRFMGYFCDGLQDCKSSNEMSAEGRDRYRLLMEWLGLTISNVKGKRTKKSLWLLGAGNTGKSKFLELAAHLVGKENYSSADLYDLEKANFGLTKLYNKRLVGAPDMRYIKHDELSNFKKITGGDPVSIEFKFQDSFNYIYDGVLWFVMNETPMFNGDRENHVYERMCFVRCNYVVPTEKRNPYLLDELKAEAPAITAIAINYLRDLIANNYRFHETQEHFKIIEQYKKENNSVLMFVDECCIKQSDIILGNANNEDAAEFAETQKKHITVKHMYYAYRAWCMENGERYIEKQGKFSKTLKNEFGEPINIGYGFEFSTIALKKEWHIYLSSC